MNATLDALYKNTSVNVWVEDDVTRAFLSTAWKEDGRIGILIAGGWNNVESAVLHSRKGASFPQGFENVFGFRDRDFGQSNRASWGDPKLRLFKGEVFEIENHLLDEVAIAACQFNTATLTATAILDHMLKSASQHVWWMACRGVLDEISEAARRDFPEHPSRTTITNQSSALNAIVRSSWAQEIAPDVPTLVDSANVSQKLLSAHSVFSGHLTSGEWKQRFSGKEILQDVVTRFWTTNRPSKDQGMWVDLAKEIARVQVEQSRVPQEVTDLRCELLARVGHG